MDTTTDRIAVALDRIAISLLLAISAVHLGLALFSGFDAIGRRDWNNPYFIGAHILNLLLGLLPAGTVFGRFFSRRWSTGEIIGVYTAVLPGILITLPAWFVYGRYMEPRYIWIIRAIFLVYLWVAASVTWLWKNDYDPHAG